MVGYSPTVFNDLQTFPSRSIPQCFFPEQWSLFTSVVVCFVTAYVLCKLESSLGLAGDSLLAVNE